MRFDAYPYDAVAFCYDELATIYSFGRIGLSKRVQLEEIAPGDRVLYAGAGRGEDALLAARFGARVTVVDLAPGMLERFDRQLRREGLEAELIQADVALHRPREAYDVVVANYLLNLFDVPRASRMLDHLAELVRPDGLLMLADFARPEGGFLARAITEAYYRPVNWIGWALGFCALHPILDYTPLLAILGFRIRREHRLPVLFGTNPAFTSIVAQRVVST